MSQAEKDFTNIGADQFEKLRSHIQGSVVLPSDKDYDAARLTWDTKTFDQHPALVVMPTSAPDVQSAVIFSREHNLPIAMQGGGHGHTYPADNALLVNFKRMKTIEIDTTTSTARVAPGVLFKELVEEAHKYGLAPLSGFAATVGVVGYMLGGGIGWLVRQYGSGAGSIRSVEMVTADGRLLQANETTHPDLFWGIRGGGGNFGIVTSLECALYPVKDIFAGQVSYSIEQGKDVLASYLKWTETVPDELTSALRITHFPDSPDLPPPLRGKSAIIVMACYSGEIAKGETLLSPMRSLGTVLLDTYATIPYAQVAKISGDPDEAAPLFLYNDSSVFETFTTNEIDTILDIAGKRESGIFTFEIRQLGGTLARQSEDTMAFNCRQAKFYMDIQATAPSTRILEHGKQSVETLMKMLKPNLTGETLINFLDSGNTGPYLTRAAYTPATFDQLRSLKDSYDPHNVFRFNHNIPERS